MPFNQIAQALKQWDYNFNTRSETFRGDSFQCLVKHPVDVLKLALIQKTFIRSLNPSEASKNTYPKRVPNEILNNGIFDAKIAIGIGEVNFLANKLAQSGG
jgi:hypothetical protein